MYVYVLFSSPHVYICMYMYCFLHLMYIYVCISTVFITSCIYMYVYVLFSSPYVYIYVCICTVFITSCIYMRVYVLFSSPYVLYMYVYLLFSSPYVYICMYMYCFHHLMYIYAGIRTVFHRGSPSSGSRRLDPDSPSRGSPLTTHP